jgi:ABC-type multidrug transport system permease subunit
MTAVLAQIGINVRLYFRNRMALLYGYLFPTIFLAAFAVLYRHESVPLARHMGELLTVTALGGACFGLPTTLVAERERGVWRRYRLAPVSIGVLVGATVIARYVLLVSAGLLQLALAMSLGMPRPQHPLDLWLAFTCVAFALLGLGLVIAMIADSVPAVQALGQCIFLPMLIIGGVAVPLAALPEWAQRLSTFLPGRHAVDALQLTVTGEGLQSAAFSMGALMIVGAAAFIAGAAMFRWDAQERFMTRGGKAWVAVAIGAWLAVGLSAEWQRGDVSARSAQSRLSPVVVPAGREMPLSWQAVTRQDIERDLRFDTLPPDAGVVAPIAVIGEAPDPAVIKQLVQLHRGLETWPPGRVPDPAQRVRNYLYVAAVPDVLQIPLERHAPLLIFDRLQKEFASEDLIRLLYWVARHPSDGDDRAIDGLHPLGLGSGPIDVEQTRERVTFYALKLLGRLTGKIPAN